MSVQEPPATAHALFAEGVRRALQKPQLSMPTRIEILSFEKMATRDAYKSARGARDLADQLSGGNGQP